MMEAQEVNSDERKFGREKKIREAFVIADLVTESELNCNYFLSSFP